MELRLGHRVESIDPKSKSVVLGQEESLAYDDLILATGAPARRLSCAGSDLQGIHYLRTKEDSDQLKSVLTTDGPLVIVGAGYIGLEIAAVARQSGRDVIVLEQADRPLARVASRSVSQFFRGLHERNGVIFRFGVSVYGTCSPFWNSLWDLIVNMPTLLFAMFQFLISVQVA